MEKNMTKNEEVETKPPKKSFRDRMKEAYPDVEPQNDDELDDLYNRYADEKESELGDMKDQMSIIEDALNSDEDLRSVISEMLVNKRTFRSAVARVLSQEDLTPVPGDDDFDAVREAYHQRMEEGKKKADDMKMIQQNEEKTYEDFDKFCAEHNLTEEQMSQLDSQISEVFSNLLYKKVTPEMLMMFYKAMNYDSAIADAEHNGEIKGRNSAIEAKRVSSDKQSAGDGIPSIVGGGSKSYDDVEDKVSFLGKKRNNI